MNATDIVCALLGMASLRTRLRDTFTEGSIAHRAFDTYCDYCVLRDKELAEALNDEEDICTA